MVKLIVAFIAGILFVSTLILIEFAKELSSGDNIGLRPVDPDPEYYPFVGQGGNTTAPYSDTWKYQINSNTPPWPERASTIE